jgi:D-aminoacyl-tRNA deacylase
MQPSPVGLTIIASKADPASLNIAQNLIEHHNFHRTKTGPSGGARYQTDDITMVIVETECIHLQPKDLDIRPSSVIFASKHRSSTNTPALTVHATGNLTTEASCGGNPEQVSLVEPFRIRLALTQLGLKAREASLKIETTMEATHHGPTSLEAPVCFVEIGSTPEQWRDPVLGRVAADAIMAAASEAQSGRTNAVGFGGTHYSDKLTRMCLSSDYQIGHIVPRHAFDAAISERMLKETFQKTVGLCKTAVIDWKGLKGDQRRILLDQLAAWNVETVRC